MKILLNGDPFPLVSSCSLTELLGRLTLPGEAGIAVSVNREIIPRSQWKECNIHHDDEVEIIHAMPGG